MGTQGSGPNTATGSVSPAHLPRRSLIVLLTVGLTTVAARADFIGVWTVPFVFEAASITEIEFGFAVDQTNAVSEQASSLFDGTFYTSSDVGRTIIERASEESNFLSIELLITNGTNDHVGFSASPSLGGGVSQDTTEAQAFFGDPFPSSGTDFVGYDITAITMTINELSIESGPISDTVIGQVTFGIFGNAIPAPGAMGFIIIVGLLGRARRRRSPCEKPATGMSRAPT